MITGQTSSTGWESEYQRQFKWKLQQHRQEQERQRAALLASRSKQSHLPKNTSAPAVPPSSFGSESISTTTSLQRLEQERHFRHEPAPPPTRTGYFGQSHHPYLHFANLDRSLKVPPEEPSIASSGRDDESCDEESQSVASSVYSESLGQGSVLREPHVVWDDSSRSVRSEDRFSESTIAEGQEEYTRSATLADPTGSEEDDIDQDSKPVTQIDSEVNRFGSQASGSFGRAEIEFKPSTEYSVRLSIFLVPWLSSQYTAVAPFSSVIPTTSSRLPKTGIYPSRASREEAFQRYMDAQREVDKASLQFASEYQRQFRDWQAKYGRNNRGRPASQEQIDGEVCEDLSRMSVKGTAASTSRRGVTSSASSVSGRTDSECSTASVSSRGSMNSSSVRPRRVPPAGLSGDALAARKAGGMGRKHYEDGGVVGTAASIFGRYSQDGFPSSATGNGDVDQPGGLSDGDSWQNGADRGSPQQHPTSLRLAQDLLDRATRQAERNRRLHPSKISGAAL
ncbi:hypothetical protein DFJ73DRAFT_861600 [Zopfochytrium polystomum]|nr:hypothetical protein DFJ73DRAFT_861600 [Zopfochytrium polystomum]